MFRVTIDDHVHVEISEEEAHQIDLVQNGPTKYHAIVGTKNYSLELLELDLRAKTMLLNVNGRAFHIHIEDQLDLLIERLGLERHAVKKLPPLVAPMPGLVIKIPVQVGTDVNAGDALIILEAMKMENVLKASQSALVQSILVQPGQAVKPGDVLMTFE